MLSYAQPSQSKGKESAMQYKIINGSVYYDGEPILESIDIEINSGEKIAIVGRNGCGKTTLLKAITGEVEMEEGTGESEFRVISAGSPEIAYLRQMPFEDENRTLEEEVRGVFSDLISMEEQIAQLVLQMEHTPSDQAIKTFTALNDRYLSLGGMTYQKEYKTMIRRFGFTEEDEKKPVSAFSGGQRTKISFIKMLLQKPDILLLDEPTNHLDVATIQWLEDYLKSYSSALVIVSHDRMFLDRIVGKVYEIEWGEMHCYRGNYSAFEMQKKERHEKQQKDHEHQKAEIERITRLIERFRYKATKAKMVQSKIKLLERMQRIDAPERYHTKTYHTSCQPRIPSSRNVLEVTNLVIGYGSPLAKVSFRLERGQRIGIIGGNGIGKSTLLKTLMGTIPALSGDYHFGYNTELGYFDQQNAQINGEDTVFGLFSAAYPQLNDTEVRSALGAFQFSGEDVFRLASTLSGGEKVRLALCKLFQKRPNVLILDEPTNHMDIIGKETLEDILAKYEGTVIFVSHDRYFVNKIADRLLVFEDGAVTYFPDNYAAYEEKRLQKQAELAGGEEPKKAEKPAKGKYVSPLKELDKKKRRVARLEELIGNCEEQIRALVAQTESPEVYSDYQKLTELQTEIDRLQTEQATLEEEWTLLSEELEG